VTEGAGDTVDAIDPFELVDPVEILSKLPADFYDKMVIIICLFVCFWFLKALVYLLHWLGYCMVNWL